MNVAHGQLEWGVRTIYRDGSVLVRQQLAEQRYSKFLTIYKFITNNITIEAKLE